MDTSLTIARCIEVAEKSPLVMAPSLDFDDFYVSIHEQGDTGEISKYFAKTIISMLQLAVGRGATLIEIESAVRVQIANHVYATENHQPYEILGTQENGGGQ